MKCSTGRHARSCVRAMVVSGAFALVAITAAVPAQADRRLVRRFSLRAEVGGGTMASDFQRNQLGFNAAIQGSGRIGFDIIDWLAVQASFSYWGFTSNLTDGGVVFVGAGPRFQIPTGRFGRVMVDTDLGWARTGSNDRFMLDVGLGYDFNVTNWFALGPSARYGRVFAAANDFRSDAQFWSLGAGVTLRVPDAPPPPPPPPTPIAVVPPDRDADGVADADDLCIDEPRGDHPDTQRIGCPLHDTDGDLVFDDVDVCVTTPAGDHADPERAGCPDGDDDVDLALNHVDQCRSVPAGLHPDPERLGCPEADRDGDNVPDRVDHCPDRPGAPHPNARRNGCPGLVVVDAGRVRILRPILFATNRDRILPRSFPVLQAVLYALDANPSIRRLAIDGHTDSVGDDARNLDLSQRRSRSVFAWLVSHGMDPVRLEAHGYGETRPIAANDTRTGRASNRRVEFLIADPTIHVVDAASASSAPPPAVAANPASAAPAGTNNTPSPASSAPRAQSSSAQPANPALVASTTRSTTASAAPPDAAPARPRAAPVTRPRVHPAPHLEVSRANTATSLAVSTPATSDASFTPAGTVAAP